MPTQLALPSHPVRSIVYCGTPEVAVLPLRRLHEAGFEIPLVLTGEDKRRGRGSKRSPSPVKLEAQQLGLEISHDPADLNTVAADLGVVVAYGRLIKTVTLKKLAMVNLHFSLLPRWRGAAPVERAILAGDAETGVCLMALAPKLDTGDIYRTQHLRIDGDVTLEELRSELVEIGSEVLLEGLRNGLGVAIPQAGESSYADKIAPAEYELDFSLSALEVIRVVRLGAAWTMFRGKRLKVLQATVAQQPLLNMAASQEAASNSPVPETSGGGAGLPHGAFDGEAITTAHGRLQFGWVQPAGKKPMTAKDWLNGVQPKVGEHFG